MKEKVFRFRAIEKRIAASRPGFKVLDVGCGRGDNLRRLKRYGGDVYGIEPSLNRTREASKIATAVTSRGEELPFPNQSFEMVYISHVLHHAVSVDKILAEANRILVPGGLLFVIETIDDSPLMRVARALRARWDDDEVLNRFRYADLALAFDRNGFAFERGEKFNWMYFAWELLPMALRPLEFFTPIFIGLETLMHPLLKTWGGHCWLIGRKRGPKLFAETAWQGRV